MNKAASISVLPEGCLSHILSLTTPSDACRAAAISKGFKSAADSDTVWGRFLPPDYREIIAHAVSPVVFGSKKQLYLFLSDTYILLDRSTLSFQLDKESGKKCYMFGAKELSFACQDVPRYWEWGHVPYSRFPQACILKDVCGLAVGGKIAVDMLSQRSRYVVYLVIQASRDFKGHVVLAKTKGSSGKGATDRIWHVPLQQNDGQGHEFPRGRKDCWMEIKCGEFELNEEGGEVEVAFEEVSHGNAKNDLIVEGMEFRLK